MANSSFLVRFTKFLLKISDRPQKFFGYPHPTPPRKFSHAPLTETKDIVIGKLFKQETDLVFGNKLTFKAFLELSVNNTHFIFDGKIYKKFHDVANGEPVWEAVLGNMFM